MKNLIVKDINYALVEEKRPPIYTSLKYWGKKPHNIWYEYIKNYTGNGFFLDPFSGSGMSAFEAFRCGKKSIAIDINPLNAFIIETMSYDFNEKIFCEAVDLIVNKIRHTNEYKKMFSYFINYPQYELQNVKWNENEIYEVCIQSIDKKNRLSLQPTENDYFAVKFANSILIDTPIPTRKFRESDSFSKTFKEKIGDNFSKLYTHRNLWVLSKIFDEINKINNSNLQKQLLFAFIQIVHLSTKMCVPRSKTAHRDFSTSWGRSAFIYSKKQMEMNPLILFEHSKSGKQSAFSCLSFTKKYLNKTPIIKSLNEFPFDPNENVDIWYGTFDIKKINTILPENIIDFVITDPPYGGLVQYLDLSTVWLSWLELIDEKYIPDYKEEITINGKSDISYFESSLTVALKSISKLLKNNAKIVLTFNNNNIKIWNSLLCAIEQSGFLIEKVIHQQNKRTGESNVANPYGTSGTDFYIRCVRSNGEKKKKLNTEEIQEKILLKIIEIIEKRGEPTPYQIIFNGLLVEISSLNYDLELFNEDISSFLKAHNGKELFLYSDPLNKSGSYWWINHKKFDPNSENSLSNLAQKYIKCIFLKHTAIKNTQLLQQIYKEFPNGLTLDYEFVISVVKKYAVLKNDTWWSKLI